MNAIELLELQHRDATLLFHKIARAKSTRTKRRHFDELADLLAIHSAIEEKHFYPAVRARRTEEILLESLEEHLSMKRVLVDCMATSAGDASFAPKLAVLKEQIEHHVKEEETDLFPKVRHLFDKDQLEAVGQMMVATMTELQKGTPRLLVLPQTIKAPSLDGDGIIARIAAPFRRVLAMPGEIVARARMMIAERRRTT